MAPANPSVGTDWLSRKWEPGRVTGTADKGHSLSPGESQASEGTAQRRGVGGSNTLRAFQWPGQGGFRDRRTTSHGLGAGGAWCFLQPRPSSTAWARPEDHSATALSAEVSRTAGGKPSGEPWLVSETPKETAAHLRPSCQEILLLVILLFFLLLLVIVLFLQVLLPQLSWSLGGLPG